MENEQKTAEMAPREEIATPETTAQEEVSPKGKTAGYPEIKPGMTVKVHQKIKEMTAKGEKERIQIFEGMVLARKGGRGIGSTVTVRKISEGIGVERIFPLHSPSIAKIVPVKQAKVKKSKLYFLRGYKKKLQEKKI